MSTTRAILPATGGGALLAGIFYNRFIIVVCGTLLGLVVLAIVRTIRGRAKLCPRP